MTLTSEVNVFDDDLFDDTAGYEDEPDIRITRGLSDQEKKLAALLYNTFTELWGLAIVIGAPGAGKDTFLNWFLYTIKRLFPQKRILRDEKPRRLFGRYAGLFNEQRIQEDLQTMREIASGKAKEKGERNKSLAFQEELEKQADEWAKTDKAKAMLHNSVVGCTEYWKYVYNREPWRPINKTMGGIHKVGRHIPTLIIGCVQQVSDLDKKTCKPFVNWQVNCRRTNTTFQFLVTPVVYNNRRDVFEPRGRATALPPVDAGKPRDFIGDGKIRIRKSDYKPATLEEEIVLDAIKEGYDDYSELVDFLEDEGGMPEAETLATLKDLALYNPMKRKKFAIWYPCYYFIFNSRSAPNITTKVKAEE